jgi:NADH dehydrogenase FAD-containing subunit
MTTLFGRRAVVVGGGIGGLSVAGALAGTVRSLTASSSDRLAEQSLELKNELICVDQLWV